MFSIGFDKIQLFAWTIISVSVSASSGQSCDFKLFNSMSRRSGSGFSNSGNYYKTPNKITKDCPCFHHDADRTNCQNTTDPMSPLIECAFLPREFIECALPVDHKGNQSARDTLGHGCTKVKQKIAREK